MYIFKNCATVFARGYVETTARNIKVVISGKYKNLNKITKI